MKLTIEDLKITKTFYRRNRDAFGNRTKEAYESQVKRKVRLVTGWLRFAHYLIDGLIIGVILFGFDMLMLEVFSLNLTANYGGGAFYMRFIPSIDNIIITFVYYFICEKTMQRTIGKFATGAVVINQYAETPSDGSLIGRSFARLVPFEPLSCLSDRGWHDTWSKTYVVTVEERDQLRDLLHEQGVFVSTHDDILD